MVKSLTHILIPGVPLITALPLRSSVTWGEPSVPPVTGPHAFKEAVIIILILYGISVSIQQVKVAKHLKQCLAQGGFNVRVSESSLLLFRLGDPFRTIGSSGI